MSDEQYRTVREVADLLKVNDVTVRRWIKDGQLRAIEIGKGWRIGSKDLDAFLEDRATRPASMANGGGAGTEPPHGADTRMTREQKT